MNVQERTQAIFFDGWSVGVSKGHVTSTSIRYIVRLLP
jgi:hypothetical protein